MTATYLIAKQEIDILIKSHADPENRPLIEPFKDEILALCEKFGNNGDSGGSAPYVANAIAHTIKHLLLQQPISPITGIAEEWILVADDEFGPLYQNVRCGSIFKNENSQAYYIDAITKKTQNGFEFNGPMWLSKDDYLAGNIDNKLTCKHFIKSFPFTPKTFYIDVIEEEVARDDWEMYVKDPRQLEEVWKYYDRKPVKSC